MTSNQAAPASVPKRLSRPAPRAIPKPPPSVHAFETISGLIPVCDTDSVLAKLATTKRGGCDGSTCHQSALAAAHENPQSPCQSYFFVTECTSECLCDPDKCQNRFVSRGRPKTCGPGANCDVEVRPVFGVTPKTREALLKALPESVRQSQLDKIAATFKPAGAASQANSNSSSSGSAVAMDVDSDSSSSSASQTAAVPVAAAPSTTSAPAHASSDAADVVISVSQTLRNNFLDQFVLPALTRFVPEAVLEQATRLAAECKSATAAKATKSPSAAPSNSSSSSNSEASHMSDVDETESTAAEPGDRQSEEKQTDSHMVYSLRALISSLCEHSPVSEHKPRASLLDSRALNLVLATTLLNAVCDALSGNDEEDGGLPRGSPDLFAVHSKGLGVICKAPRGFAAHEFVAEYLGEVYPAWRWCEKQDAALLAAKAGSGGGKKSAVNVISPGDFYNISLDRPRDDKAGFDLLFVDAMHRGNFASVLSHSCAPNCHTMVVATQGKLVIALTTMRPIAPGEELTIDYCCVTNSLAEQELARCFCGAQSCRGVYMDYAGEHSYRQIVDEQHTVLERTALVLRATVGVQPAQPLPQQHPLLQSAVSSPRLGSSRASTPRAFWSLGSRQFLSSTQSSSLGNASPQQHGSGGAVSQREIALCDVHGFRSSVLGGLPAWGLRYTAAVLEYVERERILLPSRIRVAIAEAMQRLKQSNSAAATRRASVDSKDDARAVKEASEQILERLQGERECSLAIALDKIKHVLRGQQPAKFLRTSSDNVTEVGWVAKSDSAHGFAQLQLPHAATATASSSSSGEPSAPRSPASSRAGGDSKDEAAEDAEDEIKLDWWRDERPEQGLPAPLFPLSIGQIVQGLWTSRESLVNTLLACLQPHIHRSNAAEQSTFDAIQELADRFVRPTAEGLKFVRSSLLKIRDLLLKLPPTPAAFHNAAADLLFLYANTTTYFAHTDYSTVSSPDILLRPQSDRTILMRSQPAQPPQSPAESAEISLSLSSLSCSSPMAAPLDDPSSNGSSRNAGSNSLQSRRGRGPKRKVEKRADGTVVVPGKLYPPIYAWAAMTFWLSSDRDPVEQLQAAIDGPLLLPGIECCYSSDAKTPLPRAYARAQLMDHLFADADKPWPRQWHWVFNSRRKKRGVIAPRQVPMFGTPWLDAVLQHTNPASALFAVRKLVNELRAARPTTGSNSSSAADADMTSVESKKRKADASVQSNQQQRVQDSTRQWSSSKRPKFVPSRPPQQKKSLAELFS